VRTALLRWTGLLAVVLVGLMIGAAIVNDPITSDALGFVMVFVVVGWLLGIPLVLGFVLWANPKPRRDR
jgi:hypothetical protein